MNQWYYSLNGQPQGPVSEEEVRRLLSAGMLTPSSLVWTEGWSDWAALETVMPARQRVPEADGVSHAAPAGVLAPTPVSTGPEREHPFEFRGRAPEFFRIWIVNVVLTVITFGIYAAWAKVRTNRYFYGNTLLDGKPFDFTGNPISILKGNLIFGSLFVVYAVSSSFFPPLALVVMLLILVISPWLIQKALRFRAHNTVHRNVRLNFRGTVGEAYTIFLWLIFLVPFTLGLIGPYIHFRQRKFFFGNLGWGGCQAQMNGSPGFFYKAFFKSIGLIFLLAILAILASIAMPAYVMVQKKAQEVKSAQSGVVVEQQPERANVGQEVEMAIEQQTATTPDPSEEEKERQRQLKDQVEQMTQSMVFVIIPIYLLIFVLAIYYQVRTNNYSINSTQWGALGHLQSSVRVRELMWLYISNGFAALFSLGLLIPWVMVRMARYRASKTVLIAGGSLDSIVAAAGSADSALGDAGADIFDFDIGF